MTAKIFSAGTLQQKASRSISSLGGSFIVSYGGNMTFAEKTVISATIGGTAEALGGGKFANGAVTGVFVMAYNHLADHGNEKQFDPTWRPPTELNLGQNGGGDNIGTGLAVGSILTGASGYRIGSHMSSVSRFGPLSWNNGSVYRPALRGYRFGSIPGAVATKLGAGLRIGGGILGGFGIAYTGYQMYQGNISRMKGSFDIGFGAIGFLGPVGLGVSAIYFVGDSFIPGGWQATPHHMYDQIQRNSVDGIWISPFNHFK